MLALIQTSAYGSPQHDTTSHIYIPAPDQDHHGSIQSLPHVICCVDNSRGPIPVQPPLLRRWKRHPTLPMTHRAFGLTSAGSMPSSKNCCRERTSWVRVLRAGPWAGLMGSRARHGCKGLWWEVRAGCCWVGLLPLLDHTSWSRLRLNSPLLSLCGRLRQPFSAPGRGQLGFIV